MKQSKFSAIANSLSWRIRQVKKLVFYNRRATSAFWQNQQLILDTLQKEGRIYLNPIPPVGGDGNSDNYFHFIFDLLIPLYLILKKKPNASIGLPMVRLGYLKYYLNKLFPGQLFDTSQNPECEHIEMHGMNPLLVELDNKLLAAFKSFMVIALCVKPSQKRNKVVLIERMEPPDHSKMARTGSFKRRIKNHEFVKSYLAENLNSEYELVNARLEFYTLEEQIQLFDQSVMVIAQHGAGLANICWMRPGSQVVEIKNDLLRRHYVNLSKYANMDYNYLYHRGMHIELDKRKLDQLLRNSPSTLHFLDA